MAPKPQSRPYDLILLGATGYTGKLTAEFIDQHFPDDLKWAIAGRSKTKLHELAAELRGRGGSVPEPAIEVVDLQQPDQIDAVVQQARVCISVVSYPKVGTIVVDACVRHGTDYVDTSGEGSLILPWITKYHEVAEKSGTVLIHAAGMFSGPQDITTWAAVQELKKVGVTTKEVLLAVKDVDSNVSGGTFDALIQATKHDAPPEVHERRWALSPVKGTVPLPQTNWLGLRKYNGLGLLSKYTFTAEQNQELVHRTWGLLRDTDDDYGPNFQYNEYQSVGSTLGGLFNMLSNKALGAIVTSPLALQLMKLFMPAPGSGPDPAVTAKTPTVLQVVAIADSGPSRRAHAHFSFPSGPYHTTALFLGQSAASLLYDRTLEGGLKGGCLTPAILGESLLNRIKSAGAKIEVTIES